VPEAIRISADVIVPASALSLRAVRSSGPGGQNVNKVASKVELRVDLARIEGLTPEARSRLEKITENRRDAEGRLLVVSQRTRDQHKNLEDAREKVLGFVVRALSPPRRRHPTKPTPPSRERRLADKKLSASRKQGRARVIEED
jgi:ribosome-associated protein